MPMVNVAGVGWARGGYNASLDGEWAWGLRLEVHFRGKTGIACVIGGGGREEEGGMHASTFRKATGGLEEA